MSHADVQAAVERYVLGVTTADPEVVASAFRPDAHMWGYLGGQLVSAPIGAFLDVVATAPDPAGWIDGYRRRIRDIEVTGRVGRAVLEERGYLGADFTNYFTAVHEEGSGWLLASKTFFLTGGSLPPGA